MKKLYSIPFIALFCLINIHFSNAQPVKRVMLEEMSTTLCSFCPVKSIDGARFEAAHPNAIVITHHAGFGVDAMTSNTSSVFAAAFQPYHYPSGTIDRIKFDSVPGYYTKYVGVSLMAFKWQDTMLSILNNVTPKAVVGIEKSWNPSTRVISGNVKVEFISAVDPGDLRINLYIVEDSVVGDTGSYSYDQKNNYINDNTYPELYGKTLIREYVHRNVVRNAPLGDWGQSGIIPSNPVINQPYSAPFSYTVPEKYDLTKGREVLPKNVYLVGFVSYFDTDTWKRRILNSVKVPLNSATEVDEIKEVKTCSLYPNPAANYAVLDFYLHSPDEVTVDLFDIRGNKVAELYHGNLKKGSYSLNINTGLINPGNYLCLIRTTDSVVNKLLTVIH